MNEFLKAKRNELEALVRSRIGSRVRYGSEYDEAVSEAILYLWKNPRYDGELEDLLDCHLGVVRRQRLRFAGVRAVAS